MLKHLISVAALTLPVLLFSGGIARASDIGGAPVKAIPFETTSSTIYSATYVGPFFHGHGHPQTIIITPVVPYNSITVTTGNTRLELVNPASGYSTYTYGKQGLVYGFPGQPILTQPGAIYHRSKHHHRSNNHGVSCRSRSSSHYRSRQISTGICW
jgi:hypothetical protein